MNRFKSGRSSDVGSQDDYSQSVNAREPPSQSVTESVPPTYDQDEKPQDNGQNSRIQQQLREAVDAQIEEMEVSIK